MNKGRDYNRIALLIHLGAFMGVGRENFEQQRAYMLVRLIAQVCRIY